MQEPRYINAKDERDIKAAVQQMLHDGMARTDIAEHLMTKYVPHEQVAQLITRVPSPEVAWRYRHVRRILSGLLRVCTLWFACYILFAIYSIVWLSTDVHFFYQIFLLIVSILLMCMSVITLIQLKNNDGIAYPSGFFLGGILICDSFSNVIDGHILLRLIFLTIMILSAVLCGMSFWIWRRGFPDLKLISAPPQDAQGKYIFSDTSR